MGIMTRHPINPVADALRQRQLSEQELGQLVCDLELELMELKQRLGEGESV